MHIQFCDKCGVLKEINFTNLRHQLLIIINNTGQHI